MFSTLAKPNPAILSRFSDCNFPFFIFGFLIKGFSTTIFPNCLFSEIITSTILCSFGRYSTASIALSKIFPNTIVRSIESKSNLSISNLIRKSISLFCFCYSNSRPLIQEKLLELCTTIFI